jgi:hypothetical protein
MDYIYLFDNGNNLMADDDLTPNELALALILEMQQINTNLESLTNAVYSLPEQLKNILEIKEEN